MLVIFGMVSILQLAFYYFIFTVAIYKSRVVWINAIIAGIFISALPASLLSSRGPGHFLIFGVTTFHFIQNLGDGLPNHELITHIGFTATAFIGIETIHQLKNASSQHIKRLEIINDFSKHIVSTLDTQQV
ncbi:hypothetical protein JZU71_04965, partial [bacterium]|nr:hypothetical protein [bacterium]